MSKGKKPFKMPHLFWLMMGLIFICSILTYIVPAGQFPVDENGTLLVEKFTLLGHQTPVNPIAAFLKIFQGLTESAAIIFLVMTFGASTEIFLATKSFDHILDWAQYKLQGKSDTLIIVVMFCLMVYLGGFGGSDAMVAIVPVGIVFAKKLKLDPLCALGVTLFTTMIGFGTGPAKAFVIQGVMGTRLYAAFASRFVIMNIIMVTGLLLFLPYIKKIRKDPQKSLMYAEGWRELKEENVVELKNVSLDWRVCLSIFLFIGQYVVIAIHGIVADPSTVYAVQTAIMISVAVAIGLISGMSLDDIGNKFAKGLAGMAFVCFVIGMAKSVSLTLTEGNVIHTIVYTLTLPLLNLPKWISTIGMTLIVALINPLVPSQASKAAMMIPILKPMGEALSLYPEEVVQAFQFGDGFTNLISPVAAWTVGSLATANVQISTWMKWVLPKVCVLLAVSCVIMFVLSVIGWTGAI